MKKNIKKNFFCILFILITIFYFQYSVTILWDSAHYMNYVNIFEGVVSWNNWDVVRGPVFPLIIYISNIVFSKTSHGIIINTYLYYVVMLLFCYKLLMEYFCERNISKSKKNRVIILFIFLLIVCNPIIFGFYHSLLTEFVAITLSVISCYYAYKLLNIDFFEERKKYLLLLTLFVFLTVFSWFLKQPYVSCGLFAFILAMIISIFENKKIKNVLVRIFSIVICIIILVVSINCWNKFLVFSGNNPNTGRNPTNSLGNQLINAIDFLEINNHDDIYEAKYIDSTKLSKTEKKELKSRKNNDYVIINIYDGKKIVDADYVNASFGNVSSVDSLFYIVKIFFDNPLKLLESYLINYFSIIDIYSTSTSNGVSYAPTKEFDLMFSNEISTIGYKPFNYGSSNIFYMTEEMYARVSCYEQTNYPFVGLNYVMRKLGILFLFGFKIVFLLLPIILFSSVIMRIFSKTKLINKNKLNLIIILLGFSFLHVMLHVVTGAIIDRYAIPSFVTVILGGFMFFYYLFYIFKSKRL